jgi:phospholipase C
MNESRRTFLKQAAALAGGVGILNMLPPSIAKAMAIAPNPGTTFFDAEHVVLLMQENRSFDHCFGMLRGVRGFNDPLPITLPDKNPVWFQPDNSGNRFIPFRLDIKDTKATWMGGVPHSWEDQVDARNDGKYNGWIEAKRPGNKEFKDIPLAMGYYSREDIPFYYALADAFTVCDQHFCAALTGTTTNRNYFWTGKTHHDGEKAKVRNGEMGYDDEVRWPTFPERLEDHGISWKVYQNEVSLPTDVEDESLLANFTDNNLEWFTQYRVRFSPGYYDFLKKKERELPERIEELETELQKTSSNREEIEKQLAEMRKHAELVREELIKWNPENLSRLTAREQTLHASAFTVNNGDPDYHKVENMVYTANGEERSTKVPKGDILYQFRKDVKDGKLPTVSWIVAPQKFSDHPSAPWYGAWYISEVLDILTRDPEVWKKTIFIINYDENDGYFDHVPPFVAPNPDDPDCGKVSAGLDTTGEFVTKEEEIAVGLKAMNARTSPVGLGFRVPLVIASPWSRGGYVNSEVCDITSTIQFLEKFLSQKTGKEVHEPNISSWRRVVSGDLSSAFRPYSGEKIDMLESLDRNKHFQAIYNAQFKGVPNNFRALTLDECRKMADTDRMNSRLPQQEPGTRPSNSLKYELYVDGKTSADRKHFVIRFMASNQLFGEESLGAPFNVYAPGNYYNKESKVFEPVKTWAFAVRAGDTIEYQWPFDAFEGNEYHLRVYGPNGFFREFAGRKGELGVALACEPVKKSQKISGQLPIRISNPGSRALTLTLRDDKYHKSEQAIRLKARSSRSLTLETSSSSGWYDFAIQSTDAGELFIRCAGRLETGVDSISDPFMGR